MSYRVLADRDGPTAREAVRRSQRGHRQPSPPPSDSHQAPGLNREASQRRATAQVHRTSITLLAARLGLIVTTAPPCLAIGPVHRISFLFVKRIPHLATLKAFTTIPSPPRSVHILSVALTPPPASSRFAATIHSCPWHPVMTLTCRMARNHSSFLHVDWHAKVHTLFSFHYRRLRRPGTSST